MSNSKQKIIFVLPDFHGGGAQRVLIHYANTINTDHFDVTIMVIKNDGALSNTIKRHINIINLNKNSATAAIPSLFKHLKKQKPNAVITTMAYMNFTILLLKPFFPHAAFIIREANMTQAVFKELSATKTVLFKALYRILYPWANTVIAPADIVMDDILNRTTIPISRQKIIYNPVHIPTTHTKENITKNKKTKRIEFVSAGRLHWQKGYDRLIEEIASNPPQLNWNLTILGEGPERENLEKQIKNLNLENNIKLIGFQNNPYTYLSQADYLLLPSRTEGLPNVVLESLSCGTPVIAIKEAGGVNEIAQHCHPQAISITHTIKDFVSEMHQACARGKAHNIDTSLPEIFSLNYATQSLEALLFNEPTKAGHAKKTTNGKNKA